jgi:hypothetical protein
LNKGYRKLAEYTRIQIKKFRDTNKNLGIYPLYESDYLPTTDYFKDFGEFFVTDCR